MSKCPSPPLGPSNGDRKEGIRVVYKYGSDGSEHEVHGEEGQDLMRLAHDNDIELEGACEGSLACSTCHVIVEPKYYKMLSEPTDEENDMLDLAYGLSETYSLALRIVTLMAYIPLVHV